MGRAGRPPPQDVTRFVETVSTWVEQADDHYEHLGIDDRLRACVSNRLEACHHPAITGVSRYGSMLRQNAVAHSLIRTICHVRMDGCEEKTGNVIQLEGSSGTTSPGWRSLLCRYRLGGMGAGGGPLAGNDRPAGSGFTPGTVGTGGTPGRGGGSGLTTAIVKVKPEPPPEGWPRVPALSPPSLQGSRAPSRSASSLRQTSS